MALELTQEQLNGLATKLAEGRELDMAGVPVAPLEIKVRDYSRENAERSLRFRRDWFEK